MSRKRSITPYTFLLPALVLLGIFVVYPIVAVIYYSFTDFDIVRPPVTEESSETVNDPPLITSDSELWMLSTL